MRGMSPVVVALLVGVPVMAGATLQRTTGLGLALVRQAVSRLGGSLEVDNDAGAIFTVTLPLRGGAATAGYGRRAPDGSGGRSRG